MELTSNPSGLVALAILPGFALVVLLIICTWFRKKDKGKHGQDAEQGKDGSGYAPLETSGVAVELSTEKQSTKYARLGTADEAEKETPEKENTKVHAEVGEENEKSPLMTGTAENEAPTSLITSTASPKDDLTITESRPAENISVDNNSNASTQPTSPTIETSTNLSKPEAADTAPNTNIPVANVHIQAKDADIPSRTDSMVAPTKVDDAAKPDTAQASLSVSPPKSGIIGVNSAPGTDDVTNQAVVTGSTTKKEFTTVKTDVTGNSTQVAGDAVDVTGTLSHHEGAVEVHIEPESPSQATKQEINSVDSAGKTSYEKAKEEVASLKGDLKGSSETTSVTTVESEYKVTEIKTSFVEEEVSTGGNERKTLSVEAEVPELCISETESRPMNEDGEILVAQPLLEGTNGVRDDINTDVDEADPDTKTGESVPTSSELEITPSDTSFDVASSKVTKVPAPSQPLAEVSVHNAEGAVQVDVPDSAIATGERTDPAPLSLKSERTSTSTKGTKIPTFGKAAPVTSPVQSKAETSIVSPSARGTKIPTFGKSGSVERPQKSLSIEVPIENDESHTVVSPTKPSKIPSLSRVPVQSAAKSGVSKIPTKGDADHSVTSKKTIPVSTPTNKPAHEISSPAPAASQTALSPDKSHGETTSSKPTKIPGISTKIPTTKKTPSDVAPSRIASATRPTKLDIEDSTPVDKPKSSDTSVKSGILTPSAKGNKKQTPTTPVYKTESLGYQAKSSAAATPTKPESAETPTRTTGIPRLATKIPTSRRTGPDSTPDKIISPTKPDPAIAELTPTKTESSRIPTLSKPSPALKGKEQTNDHTEKGSREKTRIPLPSSGGRQQDTA